MPADSLSNPTTSLTGTPERFSESAWDLLLASQEQARRWRHGAMDVEHLLLALLLESRFAPWVERLPVDEDRLLLERGAEHAGEGHFLFRFVGSTRKVIRAGHSSYLRGPNQAANVAKAKSVPTITTNSPSPVPKIEPIRAPALAFRRSTLAVRQVPLTAVLS